MSNIYYYLQGNIRYFFWLKSPWLLRKKIKERFLNRFLKVSKKRPECINNGECKACGCDTPALFFSNKGCEAKYWLDEEPCYK